MNVHLSISCCACVCVCVQSLLPCSIVMYNENTTFRYVYKNARHMQGVLSMLLTKAKR